MENNIWAQKITKYYCFMFCFFLSFFLSFFRLPYLNFEILFEFLSHRVFLLVMDYPMSKRRKSNWNTIHQLSPIRFHPQLNFSTQVSHPDGPEFTPSTRLSFSLSFINQIIHHKINFGRKNKNNYSFFFSRPLPVTSGTLSSSSSSSYFLTRPLPV